MASVKKSDIGRSGSSQSSSRSKHTVAAVLATFAVLGCVGMFMVPPGVFMCVSGYKVKLLGS